MATIYRLKQARQMAGLTLREAVKQMYEQQGVDISFQYLDKIEKEGCAMDSTKLIKFANFYKVSVDYLMPTGRPEIVLTDIKFCKIKNY